MTRDLEKTLAELGPEYRAVANRVISAFEGAEPVVLPPIRRNRRRLAGGLVAASFAVLMAIGVVLFHAGEPAAADSRCIYTAAYASDGRELSFILASQNADGSWANDFLTCQNAAALRKVGGDEARVAYKKAVRYLRSRGLKPLSDSELKLRATACLAVVR